ncbi:protein of unknown function (DUF4126) [Mariprofundus aestuarium]|uniref:DUF4126 domain-containing protein n=1 Tax=Mariprofundus aestuarium TaxID=1921086 RepID=A0A2K8KZQ1_MARES|nr:DUF4126 domain-containing protein [Mariprofundus aestuarium]ATX80500.1 protein of unknown function (DUF4126) [Mariprofundus aestuarium]
MEQLDQVVAILALTMGAAWASGINLYAAILVLGLMGSTGNIDLPPGLEILSDPLVIFAAGAMYLVEFFADKIPGIDTGWDMMHTFVRIPAGAMMAVGAVGEVDPVVGLAAGILGGGLAATTHAAKSGSRALINTSPEPFSNWTASVLEDVAVVAGLWTALNHPTLFLVLMLIFILLMIWLLPKLWRGIKLVVKKLRTFFGGKGPEPEPAKPLQVSEPDLGKEDPQIREP